MLNERREARPKARLADIASPEQLLEMLALDEPDAFLSLVAMNPTDNLYREKIIRYPHARIRRLQIPRPELKSVQTGILGLLEQHYVPPAHVHSYVRGRSHVSNARAHVGQRFVLTIDLENFFLSISKSLVVGALMSPPYGLKPNIADVVWRWCNFEGGLPTGAPSSPILSNIACTNLDAALARFGERFEGTITRYGDDMSFSSQVALPGFLAGLDTRPLGRVEIGEELAESVRQSGFRINRSKVRLHSHRECQRVTGIVVNEITNLPRATIRALRGILFVWRKFGQKRAARHYYRKLGLRHRGGKAFQRSIGGQIAYVGQVRGNDDHLFASLSRQYRELYS